MNFPSPFFPYQKGQCLRGGGTPTISGGFPFFASSHSVVDMRKFIPSFAHQPRRSVLLHHSYTGRMGIITDLPGRIRHCAPLCLCVYVCMCVFPHHTFICFPEGKIQWGRHGFCNELSLVSDLVFAPSDTRPLDPVISHLFHHLTPFIVVDLVNISPGTFAFLFMGGTMARLPIVP